MKRERESDCKINTNLNSSLGEIYLHGEVFPRKHVRIMCLGKGSFQFFQLEKEFELKSINL